MDEVTTIARALPPIFLNTFVQKWSTMMRLFASIVSGWRST